MDKKPYDPSEIEQKLYQEWESSGLFEPGEDSDSYSLAIPPPNVTGTLHMGHGFQNAIMDCLIRYHRMSKILCGKWEPITQELLRKWWLNGA